ncbi:copper homeostasis protein CutC [Nocardia iowensis]|uniref:PF03932 family protein CutC n=1 Tax=Nocardia iowensis TaxID=204891 RepID=A0ABX8RFM0_NOCIO|nr:copper homeostasis protein CutC [Nocardia iowensis]QXN88402.1 copper homeostasis protein CutC [Nocardia iowensis]
MRVEISVESVDGVRVAEEAGVDRVEVCGGLSDGGLTPSVALIERAVALTRKTEVHVLIRPRAGDFRYSPEEISVMVRDIRAARAAGAKGVVVGALDSSGALDPACAAFVDAAENLDVTFHRAIDVSASSQRALDQAISFGFTRVLTSGRQRSVLDGAPLIKDLVRQACGAIEVMACGGVRASNAVEVLAATGVADLHAAVRTPVRGARNGAVSFAGVGVPQGFDRFETDPAEVAALCELIRGRNRVSPE